MRKPRACVKCKEVKLIAGFDMCSVCYYRADRKAHPEKALARVRKWQSADPIRSIFTGLKSSCRKHGYMEPNVTLEEFRAWYLKQPQHCAICGKVPNKRLDVDHCHKTGKLRGLLCWRCNTGLHFIEKEGFVAKAQEYLCRQ